MAMRATPAEAGHVELEDGRARARLH
jgi:hypothetical protein